MRAHARPDPTFTTDRLVEVRLTDARHDDDAPVADTATLGPDRCSLVKGTAASAAEVCAATDSRAWQHLIFGVTELPTAIDDGRITLTPDDADARRLVTAVLNACGPRAQV